MLARRMVKTSALLSAFAVIGTVLVAASFENAKERIAENERQFLLRSLNEVVPQPLYDNAISTDTITVTSEEDLGTKEPATIYRARLNGEPVAAVIATLAPDGYSGKIKLLVAVRYDGTLLGVRVVSHNETPGLGDLIEIEKSDWIQNFSGKSLSNPEPGRWRVKKDGGLFDQFTGATITPRAVVKTVRKGLEYFMQHRDELFAPIPVETPEHG